MLCVPYQFVHTSQILENQYHSYNMYTLYSNNYVECLYFVKELIFLDFFLYEIYNTLGNYR